ncbi:MAG: pyruvate formate lyase family protein [Lentisphaeria bacterium]
MLPSLHPIPLQGVHRLSAATRDLAKRYLGGDFKDTVVPAAFILPEAASCGLSHNMRYALTVKLIGEQAPLRILPEERLSGAATLLEAVNHATPACGYPGISHNTLDFKQGLMIGYRGLRERIRQRLADAALTAEQRDFLQSMRVCLDGAQAWHRRHLEELDRRIAASSGAEQVRYREVRRHAARVPELPPENFREAVQSLWLLFDFQRLCGNWPAIGRIDLLLGPYLERDLAAGVITLEAAREALAHFWIKGTEWCGALDHPYGGDAQHYQNVILGGIDASGREVTNAVTYLILDVVEELHISDFPIGVRVSSRTPEKLWRRIAEVQRLGGAIVSIYNEDLILRALEKFGYPRDEAVTFTNDGCWELIIGGKTAFGYLPFDILQILQQSLGLAPELADRPLYENIPVRAAPPGSAPLPADSPDYPTFDLLYQDFLARLKEACDGFARYTAHCFSGDVRYYDLIPAPSPLLSLFIDDCIGRARGYYNRGAVYSVLAPHAGGLPDTANSLFVIKKLVYDEKRLSLGELRKILRADWEGAETLRREIIRDYPLYGNDSPEADRMFAQVVADYARIAADPRDSNGVLRPVGVSTFGREIEYASKRKATAFGRQAGQILATNLAPTPGSDLSGPTAVIKSFCHVDFSNVPNGCPLELKLHPTSVHGDGGLDALIGLLRAFVALGGVYLQVDVVDSEVLKDAQRHPGKYPNLSVRISGWSARFDTLNKTWQDMIIHRTQQRF